MSTTVQITPAILTTIIQEEFTKVYDEYVAKRKEALNEQNFSGGMSIIFYTVKGGLPKGMYYSDYLATWEDKIELLAKQNHGKLYTAHQSDPEKGLGGQVKVNFKNFADKIKFLSELKAKFNKELSIKIV